MLSVLHLHWPCVGLPHRAVHNVIRIYNALRVTEVAPGGNGGIVCDRLHIAFLSDMYFTLESHDDLEAFIRKGMKRYQSMYAQMTFEVLARLLYTTKTQDTERFKAKIISIRRRRQVPTILANVLAVLETNDVVCIANGHIRFNYNIMNAIGYPCLEPISVFMKSEEQNDDAYGVTCGDDRDDTGDADGLHKNRAFLCVESILLCTDDVELSSSDSSLLSDIEFSPEGLLAFHSQCTANVHFDDLSSQDLAAFSFWHVERNLPVV